MTARGGVAELTESSPIPPLSRLTGSITGMSDESIAAQIEHLVSEEHKLRNREEADSADVDALEADNDRLRAVEVELDRCWDLLRRRRALREASGDPNQAEARDADTVERYLQ